MPTFMGSLSQHEDQDAVAPLLNNAQDGRGVSAGTVITDPSPGLVKQAAWKPSGGKKINTGVAIVLENVASGFKCPNILDVKLGARLWDDDAPAAKRRKLDQVSERTTSGHLGFRVAGMKVHVGELDTEVTPAEQDFVEVKNGYKSYNKFYGRSFKAENVVDAFTTFLGGFEQGDSGSGGQTKVRFKYKRAGFLIGRFIRELESLQYVLENEESRMYSASVLMMYEGDEATLEEKIVNEEKNQGREDGDDAGSDGEVDVDDEGDGDDEDDDDDGEEDTKPHKIHEMRLIDFAHARWTPGGGPDENALKGIRSLLEILKGFVT